MVYRYVPDPLSTRSLAVNNTPALRSQPSQAETQIDQKDYNVRMAHDKRYDAACRRYYIL